MTREPAVPLRAATVIWSVPDGVTGADLEDLIRRAALANSALLRGDIEGYRAQISHTADFALMTPFGGPPTLGFDASPDGLAALARFFQGGTAKLEIVRCYSSGDMAVLVAIERQRAAVGGLPEQDWSLRVTLVFRREASRWSLAHRHADPLVRRISLNEAAVLAREEPAAKRA
ncbi:YybH family protein [Pseudoroseomonas globiformis]|uniref:YybH family protein n=1 Tax=Teichococcus globiformis TaxID=2307229 RepID=A0ABV7G3F5_9PROT